MKSNQIQEGKTYRNSYGIHRTVVSITDSPMNPGEHQHKIVAWKLASNHRSQASGECQVYQLAWWANEEVTTVDPQNPQETILDTMDAVAATSTPVVVLAPAMGVNDMHSGFVLTLTRETKGKDLDSLVTALLQLKGVAGITPVRADMQHFIAKDLARRELLTQIREVLKG